MLICLGLKLTFIRAIHGHIRGHQIRIFIKVCCPPTSALRQTLMPVHCVHLVLLQLSVSQQFCPGHDGSHIKSHGPASIPATRECSLTFEGLLETNRGTATRLPPNSDSKFQNICLFLKKPAMKFQHPFKTNHQEIEITMICQNPNAIAAVFPEHPGLRTQ